jgi:hypothetical protein
MVGGNYKANQVDYDSDSGDETIDDDLHDKLLDLVKEHDSQIEKSKKRAGRMLMRPAPIVKQQS